MYLPLHISFSIGKIENTSQFIEIKKLEKKGKKHSERYFKNICNIF